MRWAILGLAAAGLFGCGRAGEGPDAAAIERAKGVASAAADALAGTLLPELQGALQSGGATAAVEVCAGRAQAITAEVQERFASDGVRIRRTSLRVRNPANAPDEFERAWLEGAASGGGTPQPLAEAVAEDGGHELRYLRPLMTIELCVQCHGPVEQIAPEVRGLIAEWYPADAATGFAPGEVRGAISVRVALE